MPIFFCPSFRSNWWPRCHIVLWLFMQVAVASAQSVAELQKEANKLYRKDLAEAVRLFNQAWQLALTQGQIDRAANIRVDEGTAYYAHDDYHRAATVCRAGLRLTPLADSTQFKLWASLGEMYHQRNRPDSLTWCWQRADALLATRPALENEARTYVAAFWGNRGTAYFEQGDYRLAERCFQKRLLLLVRHSTPDRQAIAANQFAYFYLKTGQTARADSLFSASIRQYTDPDPMRGWLLLGLVDCRLQQKKPQTVRDLLEEARHIARKAGADGAELAGYVDQATGQYWLQQRNLPLARVFFRRSLAVGESMGRASRLAGRNLMALSRLAQQQGNLTEALTLVQRALQMHSVHFNKTDLKQNPSPADFLNGPDLFESLYWKAHLLRLAQGTWPDALGLSDQTFDQAFALSDVLQGGYSSELTKLFIQEKLRPAYREALALAYTRYRKQPSPATLAELLHRQEQGNASVLHETQQTLQNPYPNAPSRLLEQLQQAKTRLTEAKSEWISRGKSRKDTSAETSLINAELAWNQAYQALAPYRIDKTSASNLVARLQKRLDTQTAFLQYSLTPDSLLLTVVTAHRIRVLLLPISLAELTHLATALQYEAYRNPDPFPYAGQAAAQALFKKLLRPIWSDLKTIRRLMIVRDGPLHHLPMEVLETGLHPNDYLLRYMAITYAYSMYSLVDEPAIPISGKPSVLGMAPFAVDKTTLPIIQQAGYDPLEGSEKESVAVASTHSTAASASKRNFLDLLPAYQILHLATHAEASQTDPDESYIAFYPDGSSHRLYAHELGMLDLRHIRMAVLTGCNTGNGSSVGGRRVT